MWDVGRFDTVDRSVIVALKDAPQDFARAIYLHKDFEHVNFAVCDVQSGQAKRARRAIERSATYSADPAWHCLDRPLKPSRR